MKKIGLFLVFCLGVSLTLAMLWGLSGPQSQAAAALSPSSSGADWDGISVAIPMVITGTGKYQMWYQGYGLSFFNTVGLGYAESPDEGSWTKYAGNPVLVPGDPGQWDSFYRGQIALIKDGAVYKMWFSGAASTGPWQTGYATSTDGLDWDIYAGNPVLTAGAPGSWDEIESDGPTVIKDGATYKMWYHGCNADFSVCSIGYASSSDGTHWAKYAGNPVLAPTSGGWDESGVLWPRVVKDGAAYKLWYHSDGKLGYATSSDGIHWTKSAANPVLTEGWDGAGVSPATILLENSTFKMWLTSGSRALGTRGIGYAKSADGITWTQPIANPVLVQGETGVIIDVDYEGDRVRALTVADTAITITVSDGGGTKAALIGVTDSNGQYKSWEHDADWAPARPDILPGDTVSAATSQYATSIDPVGVVEAQAHNDSDLVDGVIHAPWLAPNSLVVLCELWTDPSVLNVDRDVPADDGAFQCDFSGLADITGGLGGRVGYLEPDGDMVSVNVVGPYMEIYYGERDGVGGIYAPGHSFWITVTNSLGIVKAAGTVSSTQDGGWWGHGFMPTWAGPGGECCDWSPAVPDIQPGDWAFFRSDDGYTSQLKAGTIFANIDVANDTITGPIYASWLDQPLEVWCGPQTMWPPEWRSSSANPDGSQPYACDFTDATGGLFPWDVQPDDTLMVRYYEQDHDEVIRTLKASTGAPPHFGIYLPLLAR